MRRSREEEEAEHRQQVPELTAAVGFGLAALDARAEEGEGRNVYGNKEGERRVVALLVFLLQPAGNPPEDL